jgi:hypothetical protein
MGNHQFVLATHNDKAMKGRLSWRPLSLESLAVVFLLIVIHRQHRSFALAWIMFIQQIHELIPIFAYPHIGHHGTEMFL